jgi:hypothetical protein
MIAAFVAARRRAIAHGGDLANIVLGQSLATTNEGKCRLAGWRMRCK